MNLANDIINNKTNCKFEPYKSFCLCLTALWDYTPPCVLINGQAVVFFASEKSPPTTSFPQGAGKYVPLTFHCGGELVWLRRLSTKAPQKLN